MDTVYPHGLKSAKIETQDEETKMQVVPVSFKASE